MNNKLVDVSNIKELNPPKEINNYWSLLNFFKKFDLAWYKSRNIYCEKHHIYPKCETKPLEIKIFIYLPYKYHILAHYYRSLEMPKQFSIKHRYAIKYMFGQLVDDPSLIDLKIFDLKFEHSEETKQKLRGQKRSIEQKEHISKTTKEGMKNPIVKQKLHNKRKPMNTIVKEKHSSSLKNYYSTEDGKNNKKQALLKTQNKKYEIYGVEGIKKIANYALSFRFYSEKPILCVSTNEAFSGISDIVKKFGSKGRVQECCCGRNKISFNYRWRYLIEGESIDQFIPIVTPIKLKFLIVTKNQKSKKIVSDELDSYIKEGWYHHTLKEPKNLIMVKK